MDVKLVEAGRKLSKASRSVLDGIRATLADKTYHANVAAALDELDVLLAAGDTSQNESEVLAEAKVIAGELESLTEAEQVQVVEAAIASLKTETPASVKVTEATLSFEALRDRVQQAVNAKYNPLDPMGNSMGYDQMCWVRATYADHIVVMKGGELFSIPFTVENGDDVVLGDPVEVVEDYVPVAESTHFVRFIEAKAGEVRGREWEVLLIEKGVSQNGNDYPETALRGGVSLFEGASAYADHQTNEERRSRPERSVKDKVGKFKEVKYGSYTVNGRLVEGLGAKFTVLAPWLREVLVESYDAGETDFLGFSIDAVGKVKQEIRSGKKINVVEAFQSVNSVDVVTSPAAGGRIMRLVASKGQPGAQTVEGDMDPEELKKLIAEALAQAVPVAVGTAVQEAVKGLTPPPAQSTGNDELVAQLKEVQTAFRKNSGVLKIAKALSTAQLSEASKNRLEATMVEALDRRDLTDEEITAMITEQQNFEAALIQQYANPHGLGMVKGGGVKVLAEAVEKKEKALHGFFIGADQDGVPRFKTLKEAYCKWEGVDYFDVDPIQMFNAFAGNYDSAYSHKQVRESLTTASWNQIFADVLYLMMIRAYQNNPMYDQWRPLVSDIEDVPDFQTRHWARVGGYGDLVTVAESGTYLPMTSPTDEEVTYAITKRGGLDDATLEMMTYERGAQKLRNIPVAMGRSAARTLYKFVMNMITTDNPTMAYDSTQLYAAGHNNTGTTALSLNGFDVTQQAMRKQTAYNESLELLGPRNMPKHVIVPTALQMRAMRVLNPSDTYEIAITADTDTAIDPQAFKGMGVMVHVYDQLTDNTDWWAVADPTQVGTVVMGFWRGMQDPELFVADNPLVGNSFTADKITWKIRHVYSGVIEDHRSFYRQVVAG